MSVVTKLLTTVTLLSLAFFATATRPTRYSRTWNGGRLSINEPKLCDSSVQQYSGYLDVSTEKHYFFWFFESRNSPSTDPIFLWLNGGPGCSSMVGMLGEKVGPCTINDDLTETFNPYTWTSNASAIFLDAPTNAGYSYGSYDVINTREYADDVYLFFQLFFSEFPKYRSLNLHIFGESYAGHYLPALATAIVNGNKNPENIVVPLKSIAIGNGMTDPLVQYRYFPTMACNNSYGIPVFSQPVCDLMEQQLPACLERIQKCYDTADYLPCFTSTITCNLVQVSLTKFNGANPYDVRIPCEHGNLCYDFDNIEDYMRSDAVQQELLGYTGQRWRSCNYRVNLGFQLRGTDWMRPYVYDVPALLDEANIRVLVYAGDADYVCNWYGNKAWTIELPWSGHDRFAAEPDKSWVSNRQNAGEIRTFGGLTFLRVFEAGHMMPMDQPAWGVDMANRWMTGTL